MRIRSFSYFLLGVFAATIATTAGMTLATTSPSPVGLCADKKTSIVRIADKGRCRKTERPITPSGEAGSQSGYVTRTELAGYAKRTDVAPSKVSATPIVPASLPASGNVVLKAATNETSDGRVRASETDIGLVEVVSSSVRSITRKYKVPAGWSGKIIGECPSDAPIFTGAGYYAEVDGKSAMGNSGFPSYGGYTLGVRVNAEFNSMWGTNPAMMLYVTQMCGSAVSLSPPTTIAQ